ncbi:MAG: FG-GAP and VCBS repeat-containing protein, partial [Thermoanaerobaculia bacterium]
MRRPTLPAAVLVFLPTAAALAKGTGAFQAPLTIPAGRPGPVTVNWGDFNGDGKLDLVVANGVASNAASGTPAILV